MKDLAEVLRTLVEDTAPTLAALSEAVAEKPPAPGKWSPKEILGHLIDSASINHGRFVRAQLQETLVFDGYAQALWVELQGYAEADWQELVTFWRRYNLKIARLVERVPASVASQQRHPHSLHKIAWQTVPENESTTLAYLVEDYINHLRHHLRQIHNITGT
ncbi:MAG: DinB family protein [Bacteroidota bacterium]